MLDPEAAPGWAQARGLPTDLVALAKEPALLAEIEQGVTQVDSRFNDAERVRNWSVIGEHWMPDTDLLTPHREAEAPRHPRPLREGDRRAVRLIQAGSVR